MRGRRAEVSVAVAADGKLWVADVYNQRIQQLEADGRFVRQKGATGKIGLEAERLAEMMHLPAKRARGGDTPAELTRRGNTEAR